MYYAVLLYGLSPECVQATIWNAWQGMRTTTTGTQKDDVTAPPLAGLSLCAGLSDEGAGQRVPADILEGDPEDWQDRCRQL